MQARLIQYKNEMQRELENILSWWMEFAIDKKNGGFIGKIDHANKIDAEAPKGSVLNSRILWTFSAAYQLTGRGDYAAIAERAFHYLLENFLDEEYGGVYWTVDHRGRALDTKKQIYALSFAVYGLSEYARCSNEPRAKQTAIELYQAIVQHSYDPIFGGYIEALSKEWKEMGDLRLSARDANEKKSMNTHLHVLEGFANLYRVWPDEVLKQKVVELIRIFLQKIIAADSHHLILFFDDQWNAKSDIISYGHDIEAAWLIQEAAETVNNELLVMEVKNRSLQLARAASEGLDADGGLWYEYEASEKRLIKQKHSWPQAEAMIGFFNAWQITGDEQYLQQSLRSWKFVQKYIQDKTCGEWYWGVEENYAPMNKEDKAGLWKCPYHNSRVCIEIINRITKLQN
jgi:mannobiose 2-epimerase